MPDDYNKKIVYAIKNNIAKNGLKLEHLQDLTDLCIAEQQLDNNFDRRFWFNVSGYIKKMAIEQHIKTLDMRFGDVYDRVLLWEAPMLFESFMLYMDKGRRPEKQFYLPRRKTMHVIAQDLQDLEDNKLKFLGISLPPRVGKLVSDDTPVLTKNGWKNHGELRVGDYVVGLDGAFKKVTHVFLKSTANIRVHFSDHTYIDCHENHEWLVYDRWLQKKTDN